MQEALPRRRPYNVTEEGLVVPLFQAVETAVLPVRPTDGEIRQGGELIVLDGAVPDPGTQHLVALGCQGVQELLEIPAGHDHGCSDSECLAVHF